MNEPMATTCSEKKKGTYQLLALLLGSLGIHNFYAGRTLIAVIQLLLTIAGTIVVVGFTGKGFPGGPAARWALIEIFAVKKDGKGLPFKK